MALRDDRTGVGHMRLFTKQTNSHLGCSLTPVSESGK
jgi:hypothetical protein